MAHGTTCQNRISAFDTRKKLLNRLGLFHHDGGQIRTHVSVSGGKMSTAHAAIRQQQYHRQQHQQQKLQHSLLASATILGKINPIHMKLKGMDTADTATATVATTKVHFNSTVSIVEIPSRHDYSKRIRKVIWSDRYELERNAERNAQEFQAEGWDWRNAVLDSEMTYDAESGERIHPCHAANDDDDAMDDEEYDWDGFVPLARTKASAFQVQTL